MSRTLAISVLALALTGGTALAQAPTTPPAAGPGGQGRLLDEAIGRGFDALDTDKDGKISREELDSAVRGLAEQSGPGGRLRAGGGADGVLRGAMGTLDSNKDGSVSKDEWTAAGRPAARFDAMDANKDGKITQEELAAGVRDLAGGLGGALRDMPPRGGMRQPGLPRGQGGLRGPGGRNRVPSGPTI